MLSRTRQSCILNSVKMAAEAKALLDELMGRSRNLDPSQQPADLKWSDDDVCKYFLCGFCPHELFTNTRADLGACSKIHDDALRKDYQSNPRFEKCGYEEDFLRFLNMLINDVEKRIRRGHQRLELNSQQASMNGTSNVNDEKITMLTERINELVVQAEELGCEGKVEESQGVMKLVDQLKEERHQLEMKPMMQDDGGPLMKQMEVCDVCGAFLIVGDAPQRQDEHLMGKQHAGYAQVRAEIDRRKKKVRDETEAREANETRLRLEREEREKERQREREERRRERDVERQRDRDRERDRDRRRRSRSRSRDRGGKDRRRSRSREKRRQRSSSRDRRNRRSRSRNRESSGRSKKSRRSSSRERKRERRHSRDKKSRSRSRDRKARSGDRDLERNGGGSGSKEKTGGYGDGSSEDNNHVDHPKERPGSEDGEIIPATLSGDDNDLAKGMTNTNTNTDDDAEEKEEGELCGDNHTTSEGDTKMDE